jgi:hypothetical protein
MTITVQKVVSTPVPAEMADRVRDAITGSGASAISSSCTTFGVVLIVLALILWKFNHFEVRQAPFKMIGFGIALLLAAPYVEIVIHWALNLIS